MLKFMGHLTILAQALSVLIRHVMAMPRLVIAVEDHGEIVLIGHRFCISSDGSGPGPVIRKSSVYHPAASIATTLYIYVFIYIVYNNSMLSP